MVFREKMFDETFLEKEIELIDQLIQFSLAKKKLGTEKQLMKALK